MWPVLLDMTKEESMQSLRNLELEAYAHLVSALRAQGPLNPDKRKLLKDTSQVLNIPQDRHKAEIRRAVNDEKLNTIAYHVTGLSESLEDWAQEGRRSVPLLPRMAPQTAYSAIADEAAETANQTNKQLPHPASTERKRTPVQPPVQTIPETSKAAQFRVPETPKIEDSKKRKLPICTENSSLAQHLLGPPKMSRTQQIYRQRTKGAILKEQMKLKPQTKIPFSPIMQSSNGPKITTNLVLPPSGEETIEQIQNEINNYPQKSEAPSCSNENQAPRPKLLTTTKPTQSLTFKQITTPGTSDIKLCPKKTITKPGTPLSQKLIVVSNAQTIHTSSILQKTLSIPLVKNISVKNFEKFKIVTTSTPQLVTAANNINSLKHKVVTVKTNPTTKKVIPLSLLNSKGGIKVLPIGGKIVGKTTTTSSPPLYIVNTVTPKATTPAAAETPPSPSKENGKSSVLGDILKASGVTTDDFDTQIEEFRIPNNHVTEEASQEQVEQLEEEEQVTTHEKDLLILHEGEEVMEQSEIKSDSTKENEEQFSNAEVVTDDSETVILQVHSSELTSVGDAAN
ncbi:BRCA2-interacting transcriptional repressor EMSY [Tribolium madens]|uniref:BRCA2-interacting transcriptional repressor EMSY n=1 Tax=Tribolium madens TaxID=41895 RepID=UPI001CF76790|nr:BRCA2-interacting transcriptional repressor EMSY [Tribolium madens]